MKTKKEQQKELLNKGDWQGVADLGRVVKDDYDTKFNYAVSMLVEEACRRGDYMGAFAIADKYQTRGGWRPELVVAHLKKEHGLDNKADKLFEEYNRKKSTTPKKSSSNQQLVQQLHQ